MENNERNQPETKACTPQCVEHLIGQKQAAQRVKIGLESAWRDGTAFPHSVLVGPPGLGKSLLAQVIAKEMGCELHQTLAQNLSKISELHAFLMEAGDRQVVFIDECDELKPLAQTVLYRSLEDGLLFVPKSNNKHGHVQTIPLSRFTLLVASNHESSLVEPLRDRFKLLLRFAYYSDDEICQVLSQRAKALKWVVDEDVFAGIASRSRGTPRLAIKILDACRRYVRATSDSPTIGKDDLLRALELEGLDSLGLDETERKYLSILAEAQKPLRLNVIAMRLGNLPPKTVNKVVEAYLVRSGLISKTDAGREITPKGIEHLRSVGQ